MNQGNKNQPNNLKYKLFILWSLNEKITRKLKGFKEMYYFNYPKCREINNNQMIAHYTIIIFYSNRKFNAFIASLFFIENI